MPELEKAAGKQEKQAFRLIHVDLEILDEMDYPPLSQTGGGLLFHLLPKLYEHTGVIIIANLSFTEWVNAFCDAE